MKERTSLISIYKKRKANNELLELDLIEILKLYVYKIPSRYKEKKKKDDFILLLDTNDDRLWMIWKKDLISSGEIYDDKDIENIEENDITELLIDKVKTLLKVE